MLLSSVFKFCLRGVEGDGKGLPVWEAGGVGYCWLDRVDRV
jgi:hypothetical protein